MNNPFATQAPPAAASGNPFAGTGGVSNPPNPFAAVTPPPGVQAIQQAFAQALAAQPAPANPFAPVVAAAPAPVAPPLNPPGEAGLGLAPAAVAAPVAAPVVTPAVEPEPAPRARRGRKPKAAEASPVNPPDGYSEANELAMTYGVGESAPTQGIDLLTCTTEELVQALKSRGYSVTLTDS